MGADPEEINADQYEDMLREVDERGLEKFPVGCSAFHVTTIAGKNTGPLAVTVVERDDSGTPRNCRIRYKDGLYQAENKERHKLIGGWISDTQLIKADPPASKCKRHVLDSIWMHSPVVKGKRLGPLKCRVVEVTPEDIEHDIRIEYIPNVIEIGDGKVFLIANWIHSSELFAVQHKVIRRESEKENVPNNPTVTPLKSLNG